jgi:hypothetical protein
MEKLKHMTREELNNEYYNKFGLPPTEQDNEKIICALWYGKRIGYLTAEELDSINEY